MRMDDERESDNVEDRRGDGGGGGFPIGGAHIGIGSIVIALAASYFLGVNPLTVLGLMNEVQQVAPVAQQRPAGPAPRPPANDAMAHFVSQVLADTEDTWTEIFRQGGAQYRKPKLVLFSGATQTQCGRGLSATGPFYCPPDERVYIDLAFYQMLKDRFKAPGDFAQAYVIAHEVGHHVQHLLGVSDKVDALRSRETEAQANAMSVRIELQADCYAGVWAFNANRTRNILEQGDVEQALRAATAIGDDALQQQARGAVRPDTFTHGTSEQRVRWFRRGIDSGRVDQCNTFNTQAL